MNATKQTVRIAAGDNVVIALGLICRGTVVDGLTIAAEVPPGHKIAARPIRSGETVVKFGYPIGVATRNIAAGEHVHSHNLRGAAAGGLPDGCFTPPPGV